MKGELRKKEILEASKKVFSTKGGYHEAHVEDVIREAKIGKGTFYQYFRNKEDLFVSLLELFLDEWEAYVVKGIEGLEVVGALDYMKLFIEKSIVFFYQDEYLCNIYLGSGVGFGSVFEPYIERFESRMLKYVVDVLESGLEHKQIREDLNVELSANIFLGAMLRIVYHNFVLKKHTKRSLDVEKISQEFFEIAKHGILPTGSIV